MSYMKRQKVPKNWPIARKGTAYVVGTNNFRNGIPVLIILRDILKIVQNRKELRKAINQKHILVNNRVVTDDKKSVLLFDVVTIVPGKKNYRMELSQNGKYQINEIKESEAGVKPSKIINKKILKGKKTQINLSDGNNFLSDVKCKVNDSVLINFKSNKIEKCMPLKDGARVIIFEGKHAGKDGVIKNVEEKKKIAGIEINGKTVNVLIKQFMVTE